MLADFKYALRQLAKSPGFTAVAVATLAFGIGANTAIFSMVNGALLKPLPFGEPDRIVVLSEETPRYPHESVSTLNFLDWRKENTVFSYITAAAPGPMALTGGPQPLQIMGTRASASYFEVLGARPELGRTFLPGEDQPGREHVVVISHKLWKTQLAGDPGIVGRTLQLDGEPYTVIGVMPSGSYFDRARIQLYRPLVFTAQNMSRDFRWLIVDARLKPGVTLEQARAQMKTIGAQLARDYPASNNGCSVRVDSMAVQMMSPQLHQALYTLLAAVGVTLLIACANLANLTLARGISREREIAIRASLGAGRWALTRQFLAESILLCVTGGALGLALGQAMLAGLKVALPANKYASQLIPPAVVLTIDGHVLLFTLGLSVLTTILFGLAPALQFTRPNLAGAAKETGPGTSQGRSGRRLRSTLVVAEIALAFVLLAGAGLLIRSLSQMLRADFGFESTNVVTAGLPVSLRRYPDADSLKAYLRRIEASLRALPGVRSVALTSGLPLMGSSMWPPFQIAGQKVVDPSHRPYCILKSVSPSYFETLKIHLRRGRYLSMGDVSGAANVAVINATMARKYFAGTDPLGKQILFGSSILGASKLGPETAWTVVGVVADEKVLDIGSKWEFPVVYSTYEQSPNEYQAVVVRAAMDPSLLQTSIRKAVEKVDQDQVVMNPMTLEEIKSESTGNYRFVCLLLATFGGTALLLSALGIYGVISYSVAQRTREIGIRSALGASAGNVRRLILSSGLRLAALGLLVGFVGTFGLARLMSSLLYNTSAQDPATIAAAAVVLGAVALLACYFPARRAIKIDPIIALRAE